MSYEVVLVGGHADGQTFTTPDLPPAIVTELPAEPWWMTAADGPTSTVDRQVLYTLELDGGVPRRSADGRYVYRAPATRSGLPVGVPRWLVDAFPGARDWQPRGEGRWRGVESPAGGGDLVVFVQRVVNGERAGHVGYRVSADHPAATGDTIAEDRAFRRLEAECREMLAPPCVAPGCGDKGRYVFHAAADGRFASRDWMAGDEIRLCARHAHDVYRAVGVRRDDLPDWLRVDVPVMPVGDDPELWRAYWAGENGWLLIGTQPRWEAGR